MTGGIKKEIENLLGRIVVFEVKFKEEILEKSKNLNEKKLSELKQILFEVSQWQEKIITKIIKEDPGFLEKMLNAKRKAEQGIISLYKQKLEKLDHEKMQAILSKIDSI